MKGGNTAAKQIKNLYHHVILMCYSLPKKHTGRERGGKGKGNDSHLILMPASGGFCNIKPSILAISFKTIFIFYRFAKTHTHTKLAANRCTLEF